MASASSTPRPLAPALLELLELALERRRIAPPAEQAVLDKEVARLERGVAFWVVEDRRVAQAAEEFSVSLTIHGRTYLSDPLRPPFWEWLLSDLLADPNARGMAKTMFYAFPLRRFRNWGLWALLRKPAEVDVLVRQLLGRTV